MQKLLTVQNPVDLHENVVTKFIQETNKFKSQIFVLKDGNRINAKSIMGLLASGISKGSKIILEANGPDEEKAIQALSILIENSSEQE
ncbi:HPr family phosphocarrier protein [Garciella nitratireducens]|uniref:HPr family phosphocarrier protein n=1 Tax=Garciella nitratireducens TaxID=218205 RepID=UPI000DE929B8|nr:HPr family phosphocarrier protein [Garciella nitratireducens]RBP42870.1 phosphocarrier protein [Garciella nitratireducens]